MARKSRSILSAEEKAAMRETVRERKAAAAGVDGETQVREKIAEMEEGERALAQRLHEIVREVAPDLTPRTWYGMPAYSRGSDTVLFFQPATKFKARYSTLGFTDRARLDEGDIWPNSYAVSKLTPAVEKRMAELVKRAVG